MEFEPNRAAALNRLAEFCPLAGYEYANLRNFDDGTPGDGSARSNVSQLSPWLHAGLIGEAEVVDTVLGKHSPEAAEKFIAEVFWRIYFKGYLEQRPTVWTAYCTARDEAYAQLEANTGLQTAWSQAIEGRTGIEAFDHWAHELVETGYLHNHARMWFASIWIFTLKIDWTLGADFFLRHLVDGDAASNTLSWRWVGGLHTKGKTYLARADNIARYTQNHPKGPLSAEPLATEAPALEEAVEHGRRALDHLPGPITPANLDESYALILHDEAASHVPLNLPVPPKLVIAAARPAARSPKETSAMAIGFAEGAVADGAHQAGKAFGCPVAPWAPDTKLSDILIQHRIDHIACPYLPSGWTRDALLPQIQPMIDAHRATIILGDLERATWPYAKAGFFGVKKKIDAILREVGLYGSQRGS